MTTSSRSPSLVDGEVENVMPLQEKQSNNQKEDRQQLFVKLNNLEALYDEGFLSQTEYKQRRLQLIDSLTGTTASPQRVRQQGRTDNTSNERAPSTHERVPSTHEQGPTNHEQGPTNHAPCPVALHRKARDPNPPLHPNDRHQLANNDKHANDLAQPAAVNDIAKHHAPYASNHAPADQRWPTNDDGGRPIANSHHHNHNGFAHPVSSLDSSVLTDTSMSRKSRFASSDSSSFGSSSYGRVVRQRSISRYLSPIVVPQPPPNFRAIPPEVALKHSFNLRTRTWTTTKITICLDDTPFAKGGLRLVYHMQEVPDDEYAYSPHLNTSSFASVTISNHSEDYWPDEELVGTTVLSNDSKPPPVPPRRDAPGTNPATNIDAASDKSSPHHRDDAPRGTEEQQHFMKPGNNQSSHRVPVTATLDGGMDESTPPPTKPKPASKEANTRYGSRKSGSEPPPTSRDNAPSDPPHEAHSFVAKMAIDPDEDPCTYFRDVEMQSHCSYYARLFNTYNPPRRVEFCDAWVIELLEREGSPLCAVERYIPGSYKKHNNNFGYVSDDDRNTPQAFSHFTYEASAHTMLVVDIQGVGDHYTDPQIHTINGTDFGKGNLGKRGFEKFLSTHRCNSICRYLKLPSVNPKYNDMDGTVPALPYMHDAKIHKRKFKESHYFESTPALQKYVSGNSVDRSMVHATHQATWVYSDDMDQERCTVTCTIT